MADEQQAKDLGALIYSQGKTLPMTDEFHTAPFKEQEWMITGWTEAQDKYFKRERASCACPTLKDLAEQVIGPKSIDALSHLVKPQIIKLHDDGDLTVKSEGKLYVVTTEGKIFEEK